MTLIKGISGIRGIVNQGLNKTIISSYAFAFSKIQKHGKILIARDARPHGKKFLENIECVFNNFNIEFDNYDIIPTPTAQFLISQSKYVGGIVITASHNPIDWNGMKFIDEDGCFLSKCKVEKLNNNYEEINITSKNQIGIARDISIQGIIEHINHTCNLSFIDKNLILKKRFKVAIDSANGAASYALPLLLEKLGCIVHKINCTSNGTPNRGMEPLNENLDEIANFVKNNNLDIGFATDPDGDRLAIIDDKGKPIGEELTLPICILSLKSYLSNTTIVTNLSSSMMIEHVCKNLQTKVVRTAVGEINVVEEMKRKKSIIGGEGNGGVILNESHLGRDSIVGVTIILNYLAFKDMKISALCNRMPKLYMIKEKIAINNVSFENIKSKLKHKFDDVSINEIDGIKFIWDDKWLHIRPSNTEPIIRIFVESHSKSESIYLSDSIKNLVDSLKQ